MPSPSTTLQALYALFDNCNSLHTNAYDEAITTPTPESVRRAVAIQMIINKELGLNFCENPWQGSFIIDELTDLVKNLGHPHLSEKSWVSRPVFRPWLSVPDSALKSLFQGPDLAMCRINQAKNSHLGCSDPAKHTLFRALPSRTAQRNVWANT